MAKNNKRTGKRKPRREIGLKEPKNYLLGKYGAVPHLSQISFVKE